MRELLRTARDFAAWETGMVESSQQAARPWLTAALEHLDDTIGAERGEGIDNVSKVERQWTTRVGRNRRPPAGARSGRGRPSRRRISGATGRPSANRGTLISRGRCSILWTPFTFFYCLRLSIRLESNRGIDVRKVERVWQAILDSRGKYDLQQQTLAQQLNFSTSLIHSALEIPRRVGAVHVFSRGFRLIDYRKLLVIWAVHRNLEADILQQLYVNLPVGRIEGLMIHDALFTGCSQYKLWYGDVPANYGKVYVYVDPANVDQIVRRYVDVRRQPPRGQRVQHNLILLRWDKTVLTQITPELVWVDLFNMSDWWAHDFRRAMDKKLQMDC
jgi:hypothetical protein